MCFWCHWAAAGCSRAMRPRRGLQPEMHHCRSGTRDRQRWTTKLAGRENCPHRCSKYDRRRSANPASGGPHIPDNPPSCGRGDTVNDAELVETMRFFASRMKLVVEPTGCLERPQLSTIKLIPEEKESGLCSGGNIDPSRFAEFLLGR